MRTDELDYELPEGLVARTPPPERDGGRLLVVSGDERRDAHIVDLPEHLAAGSLVVLNDTRVIHARLMGRKHSTGGLAEVFLVEPLVGEDPGRSRVVFRALGRASKGLRPGQRVDVDGGLLAVEVLRQAEDDARVLEVCVTAIAGGSVAEAVEQTGRLPLPPYLGRDAEEADLDRYQTVFARVPGAVAAPTAGLHLSERGLSALTARGCEIGTCSLHVGLGTFQPVVADDLDTHPMHAERYEVGPDLVLKVAEARARGAPVVAVGTTVVRALETAADPEREGHIRVGSGHTRLLIQPGYRFRVVDRLLTNFHLPRSTLLALVWAFGGTDAIRQAYAHAIAARYRFYSYGDAMLVSPARATLEARS